MSSAQAVTAVIAAAGSGERLGAGGPKAFVPLAGRPMAEWSIEAFRAAESVRSIVVACPPGHPYPAAGDGQAEQGSAVGLGGAGEQEGEDLVAVDGGTTRAESVANALQLVDTELVAIHDAARPLVDAELIEAVVETLRVDPTADGAIAAAPVTDTVKQAASPDGAIERTLDRERLWAAQTPQVFRVEALRGALASASGDPATDEAMLIEAAGGRVLIHPAPPQNLKVTTPLDLRLAALLLAERDGGTSA